MFEFVDTIKSKYEVTGEFHEGLAKVMNRDKLWGYIDKKGKEVIPCQFRKAFDFHEGMALVSNDERGFGYIDKNGELKIPYLFSDGNDFCEGLAAVMIETSKCGYINKEGKFVVEPIYDDAEDFHEGMGIVKDHQTKKMAHIDREGNEYNWSKWVHSFVNGRTLVNSNDNLYEIEKGRESLKGLKPLLIEGIEIGEESCGHRLIKGRNERFGFLDKEFNKKIPCIFLEADWFYDDAAIIKITDELIGFVTTSGKIIAFHNKSDYECIRRFSEGLAPVKDLLGKWGFIDKNGKEVIPCKYTEVDNFSEGLAGVIDENGCFYYINKNGTKKITIPNIYKSKLVVGDNVIEIESKTERNLIEKKIKVVNEVKEKMINDLVTNSEIMCNELNSDLLKLSKSRNKK